MPKAGQGRGKHGEPRQKICPRAGACGALPAARRLRDERLDRQALCLAEPSGGIRLARSGDQRPALRRRGARCAHLGQQPPERADGRSRRRRRRGGGGLLPQGDGRAAREDLLLPLQRRQLRADGPHRGDRQLDLLHHIL